MTVIVRVGGGVGGRSALGVKKKLLKRWAPKSAGPVAFATSTTLLIRHWLSPSSMIQVVVTIVVRFVIIVALTPHVRRNHHSERNRYTKANFAVTRCVC